MMLPDMFTDLSPTVKKLLDCGIRFIVFVGDKDFICNWMGTKVIYVFMWKS